MDDDAIRALVDEWWIGSKKTLHALLVRVQRDTAKRCAEIARGMRDCHNLCAHRLEDAIEREFGLEARDGE